MKIDVKFRWINPDYSQELADFHNDGKESLENPKFDPVHQISSVNINEIAINTDAVFPLIAVKSNGEELSVVLNNMCLLECYEEKTKRLISYGVSQSALHALPTKRPVRNYINESAETITQYFDIKAETELVQLAEGLYVVKNELPIELRS